MAKVQVGRKIFLYPMPTTLVGANVGNKPNYITIAHVGIMGVASVSISMRRTHYTNFGIKENSTFSVNIPSTRMVKETDYCGLVSGKNANKGILFQTFYGKLKTAPMVKECYVNMECKLNQTIEFPEHDIFIGEVVETYCDEHCLDEGVIDMAKVDPILFAMGDKSYWRLGEQFAKAWDVGKALKPSKE